uniref:Uncharacterized protein n=1 Tax=Chlamydomonas leiostraca TaxID=1034604 RepID=A0A7S0S0A8_9CHLO|mmetsp:Transcript_37342/g.94172  ORF Transcript_37342/g.94172 Transcript_37342/m.94172 type:complete len:151 (+) Transcript_37342:82-534(+)|eukprot:CAMPEP_0202868142 /NCGR_PEP_ID=MMETSP1391-20130828/10279_1 /ASSEMBLY_ACC=CAM_ASM_000867 /TAXON_ID=1034604 /ORGANISM="Chlamydomonas leiostraca, Strain SAG 11-49" /LENGTH=150 /DNA_ID=CAMNT_0049548263 /DNA_START=73 /DNA_END=525 /DNA_ORIENTATION=+
MRRNALQAASTLLRQHVQGSGFRALGTSTQAAFPMMPFQDNEKQQQQPALPCSLPSLLLPKQQGLFAPFQQQVRTMAGGSPAHNTTSENTWADFRTKYAFEKRNDLSAGMYALILAFGLGPLVADAYAYPPRIFMMTALMTYVLYVRRTA